MDQKRLNNKGFTLIEMMVCFVLLGILLVAAAQVIASSTEVYYYSKGTSYGIQASQIVATEIKGDLERAVKKSLRTDCLPSDVALAYISTNGYYIGPTNDSIYFINIDGEQICYAFEGDVFKRKVYKAYDKYFDLSDASITPVITTYDAKYVGMNYIVKNVAFEEYIPDHTVTSYPLPVGDYKVIKLTLTVNNPQYGDYTCVEYIPLYNYRTTE